ncbi:MAG: DUF4982 domain-containing protein [Lachnospiraceae bacterium]|nr:DUF4982 domain-containing protein [Lachnospiraceae bacterium]
MKITKLLTDWNFTSSGVTKPVTIPHDFMLGTSRTPESPACADYGYFQPCKGAYTRKIGKTASVEHFLKFDGVMGLCEVYINNEHVKFHPYGYTAFICDIGRYLHDGENELRIEVDAMNQPASRWYTGAGIYREVELLTSEKDYIGPWGLTVKVLSIDGDDAHVEFTAEVISAEPQSAKLTFEVPEIGFSIARSTWLNTGKNSFSVKAVLHGIKRWTPDTPILYTCNAALSTAESADTSSNTFGIRTVVCDPERGLLLNGEPIKLYGTCNHHDNGIVGAASYRSAEERRVRILKENGFNAIRCSHNPPSGVLLDVCDRMGMLVIDEIFDCWTTAKRPYDYHLWFDKYAKEDITAMVVRDRNHPCVIMWSTGNEIYERGGKGDGYNIGRMIADTIKENDDTRPLTHAFCMFWDNWDYHTLVEKTFDLPVDQPDFWCEKIAPQAGSLDVLGYNYLTYRVGKDEQIFTSHLFMVTESYPMDAVWVKDEMDKHTKLIGEFVWTGWDYFGETGLGRVVYDNENASPWTVGLDVCPSHIANCGDFDICGFKKPQSYYRDAAWKKGTVHILSADPDNFGRIKTVSAWGFYDTARTWTYSGKEGRTTVVHLYTTADECELILNGKPLGKKSPNDKGVAVFEVEYAPGKLEAIAYIDGKISGRDELCTTGAPTAVAITPDITGKSGKTDLVFAEITLPDENGNVSYESDDEITVTAKGGRVIGTGSGKIDDTHDYTENKCRAYHGRVLAAILPESDNIVITAATGKMSALCEIKL